MVDGAMFWPMPFLDAFPHFLFTRDGEGDENGEEAPPRPVERRRYPPPELDMGVIGAAKIAGILLVPMSIVAALFGLYLQGFRADLRLDMATVVETAIEKHVTSERLSYASLSDVNSMKEELTRLREKQDELARDIADHQRVLSRLSERAGLH